MSAFEKPDAFDWVEDDSIVIPPQQALAVYSNGRGAVVIRQQGDGFDEDAFICIRPENARALAAAILREAGAALDAEATEQRPKASSAAAERQRRHRARKRNAPVTEESAVTHDENVTRESVTRHGNVTALAPLECQTELLEAAE